MNKLEDIIQKNKILADIHEPPAGHSLRFFRKSRCPHITEKQFSSTRYAVIAAASVIIAFMLTAIFPGDKKTGFTVVEVPEELSYVLQYYDSMSDQLIETIFRENLVDKNEKKTLTEDIKAYEAWQVRILNEYKNFPDERILNALIEAHKSKAEMLSEIYTMITGDNETT